MMLHPRMQQSAEKKSTIAEMRNKRQSKRASMNNDGELVGIPFTFSPNMFRRVPSSSESTVHVVDHRFIHDYQLFFSGDDGFERCMSGYLVEFIVMQREDSLNKGPFA